MIDAKIKTPWFRDPAFWVVVVSFAVFLATAASIIWNLNTSYPSSRRTQIVEGNERTWPVAVLSRKAQRVTVDARSFTKWVYLNLSEGEVVRPLYVSSMNWDLAFRRYHIIANGGAANIAARGGIADYGPASFKDVSRVPKSGFVMDIRLPDGGAEGMENMAVSHWYLYDYSTHVLTPMPHVYVVRTPLGGYFKFQILNYYCRNLDSGCVTIQYAPMRPKG